MHETDLHQAFSEADVKNSARSYAVCSLHHIIAPMILLEHQLFRLDLNVQQHQAHKPS
jgi:hypothetical protein